MSTLMHSYVILGYVQMSRIRISSYHEFLYAHAFTCHSRVDFDAMSSNFHMTCTCLTYT